MSMTRNIMSVDSGEQYKDATHWITVGGKAFPAFGVIVNAYGNIEPNTISIKSTDYKINRFIYEVDDISNRKTFTFSVNESISGFRNYVLTITNLMNDRVYKRLFNNSRGISNVRVTTGVFDATDIGKTIPLKIEITGSPAGDTTQPTKPDPGLM